MGIKPRSLATFTLSNSEGEGDFFLWCLSVYLIYRIFYSKTNEWMSSDWPWDARSFHSFAAALLPSLSSPLWVVSVDSSPASCLPPPCKPPTIIKLISHNRNIQLSRGSRGALPHGSNFGFSIYWVLIGKISKIQGCLPFPGESVLPNGEFWILPCNFTDSCPASWLHGILCIFEFRKYPRNVF